MATPDLYKQAQLLDELRRMPSDPVRHDWMDAGGDSSRVPGPDWVDLKRSEDSIPVVPEDATTGVAPPVAPPARASSGKGGGGAKKTEERKGPRDIEKDWPERTKRERASFNDDELLAAYALMERNQFRNAMGRVGNTLSSALAGTKLDNSFYDDMDRQADAPVKKVNALRESRRQQRKDEREETKLATEEDANDLNSAVTRAAQAVLLELEPGMKGLAERMTASEIQRYFPWMKDSIKARHQRNLEQLRQDSQTERTKITAEAQKAAAGTRADATSKYAEAMQKFADIKGKEFDFKQGQVTNDRWEPKDPSVVPRPTDLSTFAKVDQRTMTILDFLDVIEAAFNEGGGRIIPGKEKEIMDSYRTAVMQDQQKVLENGVLSAADMLVLEELFKSPNTLLAVAYDEPFRASLKGMRDRTKINLIRRADALGLRLRPRPIGSGAQNTQADPRPEAAGTPQPSPGGAAPESAERRAYSPSQNKTYIIVNGKTVRVEDGDTRGKR